MRGMIAWRVALLDNWLFHRGLVGENSFFWHVYEWLVGRGWNGGRIA